MAAEKVEKIVDAIKKLSVVEAFELKKALEEEFGVQAAAPVAMAATPAAAAAAEEVEEQTKFDVVLTDAGTEKVAVIRVVKEATGLGLKEAKDLVEAAPKLVKGDLSKEDATALVAKLTEAKAKAEMK